MATLLKRKVDTEFFSPKAKLVKSPPTILSTPSSVAGLELIKDFVSAEEEQTLLDFLNGPLCTWRTDLARRCMHFGGTYCCLPPYAERKTTKPEIKQAPPMPQQLSWLIERMVDKGVYQSEALPGFCIVNEYILAQGISPHTENFSFDEPVVGLSLGSPDVMRFHEMRQAYDGSVRSGKASQAPYSGLKVDVILPTRSLVIMRGPSRWEWQHEIRRVKGTRGKDFKRTSLTFRVKKAKEGR